MRPFQLGWYRRARCIRCISFKRCGVLVPYCPDEVDPDEGIQLYALGCDDCYPREETSEPVRVRE